jgi:ATP-dependent RNA helicase DeaD
MNDPETESTGAEAAPSPAPKRSDYKSDRTFADFPISPAALQALGEMNYVHATPVQAAAIEPALAGKDLIVRAKTGTGKTTAFGLPMIERVEEGARTTQALVLTPTRELAVQVAQEVALLAKYRDVRITAIYGGVGFPPQEEALNAGSEIVVGTPGRLLDHIRRGNLKLAQVKVVVLDEADEMLSMGFFEDVRKIVAACAPERQTMLFSATLDESLRGFANSYMKNPEDLHLSADGDNVHLIQHFLYETSPDYHKARALLDLIELERPHSAMYQRSTPTWTGRVWAWRCSPVSSPRSSASGSWRASRAAPSSSWSAPMWPRAASTSATSRTSSTTHSRRTLRCTSTAPAARAASATKAR